MNSDSLVWAAVLLNAESRSRKKGADIFSKNTSGPFVSVGPRKL